MRKLLFVLFATTLSMPLSAQMEMEKFYWNQGRLTLDLFETRHTGADDKPVSNLEWEINNTDTVIKDGNTRFNSSKLELYMYKKLSWYDPDKNPEWALRYSQAKFDLIEVLRRQYQNTLNSDTVISGTYTYFNKLLKVNIDKYDAETGSGTDTAAIVRYENQLSEQLNSVKEYPLLSTIPPLRPDFQIGLSVMYDFEYYMKPISVGYRPLHGVKGMVFLYHGRLFCNTSFTWSWSGGLKTDDFYHDPSIDYEWQMGKQSRAQKFSFDIGYDVIDRKYITVAPIIGIGAVEFIQNTGQKYEDGRIINSNIAGFRMESGLSIGYKNSRSCTKWYLHENMVKLNLMAGYANTKEFGKVWSINAGITFETKRWTYK